ncbi:MAG: alpha-amylase family glycosyl hydrolase [Gammaproteobacteria bacterium]|nr:alpha-amylase family glycosyl hydrolase [Gammaproteobacteria bacterium]
MPDDLFESRLKHHLCLLYGDARTPALLERLLKLVAAHVELREPHPPKPSPWDEKDCILITYGDSVIYPGEEPLKSLKAFLDRHLQGVFSLVHVLPFYPFSSDGGFAVSDFRAVNPDLGDWEDIHNLAEHFNLLFDMVLNHMSREHLWFVQFVNCVEPGVNYVIKADPMDNLSLVVRPRTSPLLSRVRRPCGIQHVWATFSNDQIDLNYANPDLLLEMIDLLLFYIRQGASALRLDAVAFLWKEIGTTCIHLPQTHEIIKLLRTLIEHVEPDVLLLTETNVPQAENISYFSQGDEAQMIYQFVLPPLLLHAIHTESADYLTHWARELEDEVLPVGCTYLNFTASHDGVGLRPLEGIVPDDEVERFLEDMRERGAYVSKRATSEGLDKPYELNISYFDAFRTPGDEVDPWHLSRFLLSQILPLCLRGIPAVYINAITAAPNDLLGVERTSIIRDINRRKWDGLELERLIESPMSDCGQVFPEYVRVLKVRQAVKAFHPDASQRALRVPDGVFAVERISLDGSQRVIALHNLTSEPQRVPLADISGPVRNFVDLLHPEPPDVDEGILQMRPYQGIWLLA